jgi:hypothetical protein
MCYSRVEKLRDVATPPHSALAQGFGIRESGDVPTPFSDRVIDILKAQPLNPLSRPILFVVRNRDRQCFKDQSDVLG